MMTAPRYLLCFKTAFLALGSITSLSGGDLTCLAEKGLLPCLKLENKDDNAYITPNNTNSIAKNPKFSLKKLKMLSTAILIE